MSGVYYVVICVGLEVLPLEMLLQLDAAVDVAASSTCIDNLAGQRLLLLLL